MSNSVVQQYRDNLAAQGYSDPRSDDEVTLDLGSTAEQQNPGLFTQYPDFASDYESVREANAPSLPGEAGRAVKAGVQDLGATAAGLGALVTGSDTLKGVARELQSDAAANAPTVGSLDDIEPGQTGAGKYFSKDALRYGIAKVAGAVPSMAETVGLAAAGGLAGSAVEPGAGTVAGAAEGAAEGMLGRGVIRSAINRLLAKQGDELVAKGVIDEATPEAVASAIADGAPGLQDAVTTEAKSIAATRAGTATNAINLYGQSAGSLYNETGDRETALVGGAASALPAMALPELVIHKLYPGVAASVGQQLGSQYVTRLATQAVADAGIAGGAMATQEAANTVVRNIAAGRDAMTFTDDDFKRIREAGIGGAAAGVLAAPLTAMSNEEAFNPERPSAEEPAEASQPAPAPVATAPAPVAPVEPTEAGPSLTEQVASMSDEDKAQTLTALTAKQSTGALTDDEQNALDVLKATQPEAEPAPAPSETVSPPPPEISSSDETVDAITPNQSEGGGGNLEGPGDEAAGTGQPEGASAAPAAVPAGETEAGPEGAALDVASPDAAPAESAQAEGGTVPAGAQPAEEAAGQEIWRTPLAEFLSGAPDADAAADATAIHQHEVEQALAEGNPVPPEVLATYQPPSAAAETASETAPASAAELPGANPPEPTPAPPEPPAPDLAAKLSAQLNRFRFGTVDEGSPVTVDLRSVPEMQDLTPEQANNFPVAEAMGDDGNRSRTRVAAVLEAPDGHYVMAGLLPPAERRSVESGDTVRAPAVQRMAKGGAEPTVSEGARNPALLSDLVREGYKVRAVVKFDADPGVVFQRFKNAQEYDAAYGASDRTTGRGSRVAPAISADEGKRRTAIQSAISKVEQQLADLTAQHGNAALEAKMAQLSRERAELEDRLPSATGNAQLPGEETDTRLMTQAQQDGHPAPIEADRRNTLAIVAGRLRQAGAQVDLFARTFLQSSLEESIGRRIQSLEAELQGVRGSRAADIESQLARMREQQASLSRVRGATYNGWHVAIGMDDVEHGSMADLVTLLHEAGHALLLQQDPAMQGRVIRAVDGAMASLRERLESARQQTGVTEETHNAEELLVSTLAQSIAAEGIPDHQSVAGAVVAWVKDLYYRLTMAVQSAFGRQPSDDLALAWFENQLRRQVGGAFDWRFADLFDRFRRPAMVEEAAGVAAHGDTPGGVTYFYDPLTGKMRQPTADGSTVDGVDWNLRFMTEPEGEANPGTDEDIPGREAYARIHAAAVNEEVELAGDAFKAIAPKDMKPETFWKIMGRGDMPRDRLAAYEQEVPGSAEARIGGERMTDAMNQQASAEALGAVRKIADKQLRDIASDREKIEAATKTMTDAAKAVNRLESDLRNAEKHGAVLQEKAKEMATGVIAQMRRGLDTAFRAGGLLRSIREVADLSESDEIPPEYQNVLKRMMDGDLPVFRYAEAISKLDLPLADMTEAEIRRNIRQFGDMSPDLKSLSENSPLLTAMASLAKANADQLDLIRLRSEVEPAQYLKIKADLDTIRRASESQIRDMLKNADAREKSAGFAARIKYRFLERRAELRRAQDSIKQAAQRNDIRRRANEITRQRIEQLETKGVGAPSEWFSHDGATYNAMVQGENGWLAQDRTLRFTPEGPAQDAERVASEMVQNRQWLAQNADKAGSRLYELVKRQTDDLSMRDLQQRYPEGWRHMLDKVIQPLGQAFLQMGHASGADIDRMLKNFQFINFSYWKGDENDPLGGLENKSYRWTDSLRRVMAEAGIKDQGEFTSQVYDPVLYFLQTEPGLGEDGALREAVRAARQRLGKEPGENFDPAMKDFLRRTKAVSESFVRIAEKHGAFVKDNRLGPDLRRAVSQGWLTVMRRVKGSTLQTITRGMDAAGWKLAYRGEGDEREIARAATFDQLDPERAPNDQAKQAANKLLENPQALSKAAEPLFTPQIVREWLEPFLNKPGASVFSYGPDIDQLDVQRAWQDSAGNVVQFIDNLSKSVDLNHHLDEEPAVNDPNAAFRLSILKQMDDLFAMESRMAAESSVSKNLFDPLGPKPHVVMDARVNDLIPPEHLEHAVFDPLSSKSLLATMSFHAAFGRNGERMTQALDELKGEYESRRAQFQSLVSTTDRGRKAEAEARGMDYKAVKQAAQNYDEVVRSQERMKGLFGFTNMAGALGDLRTGMEVLHFVVGQTVNNPRTALLNFLQPAQRALVRQTLGTEQIRATAGAYAGTVKHVLGSVLENFGLHILRGAEHAREIGDVEGQAFGKLPISVVLSDTGKRGSFQDSVADKWAIQPLRKFTSVQRRGPTLGFGTPDEFTRLNVLPGLGGVMNYLSTVMATENGASEVRNFERIVKKGVDYFAAHPEDMQNPAFQFTADKMGLTGPGWFSNAGTFDYFKRRSVEYGAGPLETIAREAADRQTKGDSLLTRDQAIRIAMMANNELDLHASINSRPAGFNTNPILRIGLPLLGWPLAQMNLVHQALKTPDGRASTMAFVRGVSMLAAWSLPVGLAYTFLTDQYDEKVLGKKSNLRDVDKTAAIPLIGPLIAAFAGNLSPVDEVKGMVERLSRAGNIYGLGSDLVGQTLTSLDPTSGQRAFSLDQRVFVMSQLLNFQQAVGNYLNQGDTATWASVWRPLLMAAGGNGALHAIDFYNSTLGLDNAEARVVERTNAQQWLRSAGREAGLEVRADGGAAVAPTPVTVWVREMQLAAYGHDQLAFLDAYRKAVDAARENGEPQPEKKVLQSWQTRNPLDVFASKPTPFDMQRVYSAMDDTGRSAVQSAISSFNQFTALIQPSPEERKVTASVARLNRPQGMSPQQLRAQQAAQSLYAY